MDICVRKPLIVTCGSDKFIRVWNYEEKTIEAYKSFNEEAHCISFHPSGFHIIVGLSDRLRLMNICNHNNQIKHFREIVPFKACREIKFSNGGQYFAAVNGTTSN
jgi:WD40 repeat protein